MKKSCLIGLPLCLFLLPSTILACMCSSLEPPYAFNEAKVVFIGRMLGGTPAADVNVHLLCPQNPTPNGLIIEFSPTGTHTDKEGRFRLEGFTSETYWIQARGLKANDNVAKNSPSLKLSINQNVKNLKLKLSKAEGFGDCR